MAKLPVLSGDDVIKILKKIDYIFDHITGDHAILIKKNNPNRIISVPLHYELKRGTLRGIIKYSGISRDEFLELMK